MIVDINQLIEVKNELASVSIALSDLSNQNEEYFQNIFKSTEKLTGLLKEVIKPEDLAKVSDHADVIATQMSQVDSIIENMTSSSPGFYNYTDSVARMSEHFSKLSNDLVANKREENNKQIRKVSKKKTQKGPVGNYLTREFSSLHSKLSSLMSTLKVPLFGAVGAGIVGLLAYGVAERQRLQAEAGEVSDVLVMAVDSHLTKLQKKAQGTVATMQESLQKFYGINRQEYQAGLSELVKGGVRTTEWLRPVSNELGLVGKNALNLSLGFDKLLNQAGGSAAKDMVDNQHKYGMSIKDTTDTLMEMLTTGRTSGLGYSRYYNSVKEAAEATEQLGVNIQTTSDYMGKMQEHFDSLDVPKHMGSALIVKGLKGLSSGVQGLPEGWKMEIAERMGMGTGLEALTNFNETWMMLQQNKGNPEALRERILSMMDILVDIFGSEYRTKYMLSSEFNMGPEGASLAWETYQREKESQDSSKSGKERKVASEASRKAFQDLKKSYKTEAQKRTQWERDMNKWMKHISHIGMGLMGMMSNWLAKMLLFFRYVPELFATMFENGGPQRRDLIMSNIEREIGSSESSQKLIMRGLKGLVDSGITLMSDAFGASIKNIEKAWSTPLSMDSYENATSGRESSRSRIGVGSRSMSQGITPPQTVRTVYIAGDGPSMSDVSVPEYEADVKASKEHPYGPRGGDFLEDKWLGKEPLKLISYGVSEQGDIRVGLVGQCPRCALDYDEGFDESSYKEGWKDSTNGLDVLTRMLYSEGGPGKIYQKGGKKELSGIAYTALNRVKKGMGKNLSDVITRGKGYGVQGNKRPYSTARGLTSKNAKEYQAVQNLAKDILDDKVENPVGGSTLFMHNTFGQGYGSKSNPVALPKFADSEISKNKNIANIGTARFYSSKGKDVGDRANRDANYKKRFEEHNTTQNENDYYWSK